MLYLVFTIATTLLVFISIFIPVVNEVYKAIPEPSVVRAGNKYLLLFVLTIVAILTAPLMFVVWSIPKYTNIFKNGLIAELKTV